MIALRPFRAWRPSPDKAHLVGSRSFVSYTREQLAERLDGNPYTFLHVIHPDGADTARLPREERFRKVREAFARWCAGDILFRDEQPSIYCYEQTTRGQVSRGIIAGVSVADYRAGSIKVHEQTLTAREALFADYLSNTEINAEPVLLTTPDGTAWEAMLDPLLNQRPEYDFSTTDRVRHRLWVIPPGPLMDSLQRSFATIPALYIADGHHRMASSARLAADKALDESDPRSWCLAYIVPRSQLYIFNFDRTVSSLGDLDEATFLERLRNVGDVFPMAAPWSAPGLVAVRTASGWHGLRFPDVPSTGAPDTRLDAARLSELVLGPLLRITDLRTDERMGFVPGIHGTHELDERVRRGEAALAFHLFPVSFEQLKNVADAGGSMPPKSTWIEPKLRSGMVVYPLKES